MNNKETELYKILDTVIECCSSVAIPFSRDDIIGPGKAENVTMTRCMFVSQAIRAGYTVETIATVIHRTPQGVRHLHAKDCDFRNTSRAYCIADAEATIKCRDRERGIVE